MTEQAPLLGVKFRVVRQADHSETVGNAPENDWMEWQADHLGGALLMPRSYLIEWAGQIAMREGKFPPLQADSDLGRAVMQRVMRRCQVSEQAARVRLLRPGLLIKGLS